jgi:hypothetical protein
VHISRILAFAGLILFVLPCPLVAQTHVEPRLWSFDISPQVGYRTNMRPLTEQPVDEEFPIRVSIDSNPSFGVAFGIRYNDEDMVEFRWARQRTNMTITGTPAGISRPAVILDQYHFDFSHEYVPQEWPHWVRPYIIGSVGLTHVSSTINTVSFTRFSFGLGGGVKAFPFQRLGFKLQAQWLPLWVSPEITAFCRFGCVIHLSGQVTHQGEVTIGPVFRF